jgi:hypothetical protein
MITTRRCIISQKSADLRYYLNLHGFNVNPISYEFYICYTLLFYINMYLDNYKVTCHPKKWRHKVPLKRSYLCTKLHGVTIQYTVLIKLTTPGTSNIASNLKTKIETLFIWNLPCHRTTPCWLSLTACSLHSQKNENCLTLIGLTLTEWRTVLWHH